MKRRVHVVVTGIVQGVNYRYHTRMTAERLGVKGWVRNRPDGAVEGCFEGDEEQVNALVTWCRLGPDSARVDDVVTAAEPFAGEFADFEIRR